MIHVREAVLGDVPGMSRLLKGLADAGKRTRPWDEEFVRDYYVQGAARIRCSVAVMDDARIAGLQIVSHAQAGNPFDAAPGNGTIGTHTALWAARQGVGRALFEATRAAAQAANIPAMEAFIGANNPEGLAYYEAMGFRTDREKDGAIIKIYRFQTPA